MTLTDHIAQIFFGKPQMEPSGLVAQIFGHGFCLCGWATAPGFPWAQGESAPSEQQLPTSLSSRPEGHVLFPTGHLAAMFVPSSGLEDIETHTEALTKLTQQALPDSQ